MKDEKRNQRGHRWTLVKRVIAILCLAGLIASGISIAVLISGCRVDDLTINFYFKEYREMLAPTTRITTEQGNIGSGVVIELGVGSSALGVQTQDPRLREPQFLPLRGMTQDAYILTAAHVVGDESTVTIEFFYPAAAEIEGTVIITDTYKDLALIRITNPPQSPFDKGGSKGGFYSARLAPKDYSPSLFAPVYAVGCSLGLQPRPSAGIITALGIDELMDQGTNELIRWEISAPIVPGNSGGPVFDALTQEVIGIAVSVYVYNNQLVTTMAKIVPIGQIYEFIAEAKSLPKGKSEIGNPQSQIGYSQIGNSGFREELTEDEKQPLNINLVQERICQQAAPTLRSGQLAVTHFVLTASRKEVIYMATIKLGSILVDIRGKLQNAVYSTWKSNQPYIRNVATVVRNPSSVRQMAVRSAFSKFGLEWDALLAEDKAMWDALGSLFPARPQKEGGVRQLIPTGPQGAISGINAFVACNVLAADVGQTTTIDKPPAHTSAPKPATISGATYETGTLTVTWNDIPDVMPSQFVRVWLKSTQRLFGAQRVDFAPGAAKTANITHIRSANGDLVPLANYLGDSVYVQIDVADQASGLGSMASTTLVIRLEEPAP